MRSIGDLAAAYRAHAYEYYRKPNGRLTREHLNIGQAVRPLEERFGDLAIDDFGPRQFREVRDAMIASGLTRKTINQRMGKIRRMFSWGVSLEHVHPHTLVRLKSVDPLRRGRCGVPEGPGVRPVDLTIVDRTLEPDGGVRPGVAAVIRLIQHTGMRLSEARIMRPRDLELDGPDEDAAVAGSIGITPAERLRRHRGGVWIYRPREHKTEHHAHERIVLIGPRGQEVVRPFIPLGLDSYIFSPTGGATPYSNRAVGEAIHRACDRLGLPRWSPLQLRHTWATMLRRRMGIEAARVTLGHRSAATTEIYAEVDAAKAAEAARLYG